MIARGLLKPQVVRNKHLKDPRKKREPWCTRSQIIRYRDKGGQWKVLVHQYMRPDQTIGGRGRPDPKRLRVGNQVYVVRT